MRLVPSSFDTEAGTIVCILKYKNKPNKILVFSLPAFLTSSFRMRLVGFFRFFEKHIFVSFQHRSHLSFFSLKSEQFVVYFIKLTALA